MAKENKHSVYLRGIDWARIDEIEAVIKAGGLVEQVSVSHIIRLGLHDLHKRLVKKDGQ